MIVADTSALIALMDADDRHHEALRDLYEADPDAWILPWSILPEVDYLLLTRAGAAAELAFLRDLADGRWFVEWGRLGDVLRARELAEKHKTLGLGLVDATVIAAAERLKAAAIATLDVRHFGAVKIAGAPKLYPRDLGAD